LMPLSLAASLCRNTLECGGEDLPSSSCR
jgi:hypothetical protein